MQTYFGGIGSWGGGFTTCLMAKKSLSEGYRTFREWEIGFVGCPRPRTRRAADLAHCQGSSPVTQLSCPTLAFFVSNSRLLACPLLLELKHPE